MDKLVSIIIPVYNVKEYLHECIESVLNQTYKKIEIILVDDGSTDGSGECCDVYEKKDRRIKVIHKVNSGVSAARNIGIDNSNGDYIVFLDSDDTLEADIIEIAVNNAETISENNYTIMQWGFSLIQKKQKLLGPTLFVQDISKEEIIASIIANYEANYCLGPYFRATWGKLLYGNIIRHNNIRFPEKLYIGEDAIFLLKYVQYIDSVRIVSSSGYNYRILDTSACRRYKPDLLIQYELQMNEILNLDMKDSSLVRKAIFVFYYRSFAQLVRNEQKGYQLHYFKKNKLGYEAKVWWKKFHSYINISKEESSNLPKRYKLLLKYGRCCPFSLMYHIVKYIN